MFSFLLISSNIVWPIFCNNLSLGSICVERFLVCQISLSNLWLLIEKNLICNSRKSPERLLVLQKLNKNFSSGSCVKINFNTGPMGNETFSRSVMISEVSGCCTPVEQSDEYHLNWSYLIVTSLFLSDTFYPLKGRAEIIGSKNRSRYDLRLCHKVCHIR